MNGAVSSAASPVFRQRTVRPLVGSLSLRAGWWAGSRASGGAGLALPDANIGDQGMRDVLKCVAVWTSGPSENESTIPTVCVFWGKRSPDFISPFKAPETPPTNKVKSLGLETAACRDVWVQAFVLGPLTMGNLWVSLGVVFWEPRITCERL